jgi:hypothetical protein
LESESLHREQTGRDSSEVKAVELDASGSIVGAACASFPDDFILSANFDCSAFIFA